MGSNNTENRPKMIMSRSGPKPSRHQCQRRTKMYNHLRTSEVSEQVSDDVSDWQLLREVTCFGGERLRVSSVTLDLRT